MRAMDAINRRELLQMTAAFAAAGVTGIPHATAAQEPNPGNTLRFFPGFKAARVKTSGAEINLVHAGSGPPLLLMHGAPQTHVSMRLIAPELAKDYTVIVPDLRGYGDSSKPADGENHVNYSKRAMALDQVEVMKSFGFDKFAVVGHDRGGRVGHRMALDHADKITRLAVLDIIPTYYLYTHVTIEFIQSYFHWFNNVRQAPAPENDIKAQTEAQKARATNEVQIEYLRTSSLPENIHAHVRGLSRRRLDRSQARRSRPGPEDRLPADDAVGPEGADGANLRRAGHLEGTWRQRHGEGPARRPQPTGRRPGRCTWQNCARFLKPRIGDRDQGSGVRDPSLPIWTERGDHPWSGHRRSCPHPIRPYSPSFSGSMPRLALGPAIDHTD